MSTAHTVSRRPPKRSARGVLLVPFAILIGVALAGLAFISYVLWPTWPTSPIPLDAPSMPVTVAGVLFDVPPAAIRIPVQRHPGPHDRIDLAFLWPSLTPPQADPKSNVTATPSSTDGTAGAARASASQDRLFVTIAGLGAVLPPIERLRSIYPRYVEGQAAAGPDGLAVLPFRTGTPYQNEDLIYVAAKPEQFFARCTRPGNAVPGTCISERALDAAEITLRFPRDWLENWQDVAAGLDRLVGQLHPQK
jgi:hypothetical protein